MNEGQGWDPRSASQLHPGPSWLRVSAVTVGCGQGPDSCSTAETEGHCRTLGLGEASPGKARAHPKPLLLSPHLQYPK